MHTQPSFLENIIDESIEMQPMHPVLFDQFLAEGWRILAYSIIRHNFASCRGALCNTIPLRIRLEDFTFSTSQRKLLRKNTFLTVRQGPVQLTPEKELLFQRHTTRFHERRPEWIRSFINEFSGTRPVKGVELSVFYEDQLIACSYFHIGEEAISGTYCFFDPDFSRWSLGTYTMLLELEIARKMGKKYYYHGYCYNVPSQFDYKLNFNNLESMDWNTGLWSPQERKILVSRASELNQGSADMRDFHTS